MKRMARVPLKWYPSITQSRIFILTYPWLCKSGYLIPTYPGISKSRYLIPTYPGLCQSTKSIPGYPGISWLAQSVVFSDDYRDPHHRDLRLGSGAKQPSVNSVSTSINKYQLISSCLPVQSVKSHCHSFESLFKKNGVLAISGSDLGWAWELTTSSMRQNSSWACFSISLSLPCMKLAPPTTKWFHLEPWYPEFMYEFINHTNSYMKWQGPLLHIWSLGAHAVITQSPDFPLKLTWFFSGKHLIHFWCSRWRIFGTSF